MPAGHDARVETLLWTAQRASAAVLAICVAVHLATIVYAVRGGLTGAEILERTHGSIGWMLFYSVFVLAVAVHAPIGVRTIRERLQIAIGLVDRADFSGGSDDPRKIETRKPGPAAQIEDRSA